MSLVEASSAKQPYTAVVMEASTMDLSLEVQPLTGGGDKRDSVAARLAAAASPSNLSTASDAPLASDSAPTSGSTGARDDAGLSRLAIALVALIVPVVVVELASAQAGHATQALDRMLLLAAMLLLACAALASALRSTPPEERPTALCRCGLATLLLTAALACVHLTVGCGALECGLHGTCSGALAGASCVCTGNHIGQQCELDCGCPGTSAQLDLAAAQAAGSCAAGSCICVNGYDGEACEWPPSFVLSGCTDGRHCGTFTRNPSGQKCDGAPTFTRVGGDVVLYRKTTNHAAEWLVGPSDSLATCSDESSWLSTEPRVDGAQPTGANWYETVRGESSSAPRVTCTEG